MINRSDLEDMSVKDFHDFHIVDVTKLAYAGWIYDETSTMQELWWQANHPQLLWLVGQPGVLTVQELRLFAADCLQRMHDGPEDPLSHEFNTVLDALSRFAYGLADEQALYGLLKRIENEPQDDRRRCMQSACAVFIGFNTRRLATYAVRGEYYASFNDNDYVESRPGDDVAEAARQSQFLRENFRPNFSRRRIWRHGTEHEARVTDILTRYNSTN